MSMSRVLFPATGFTTADATKFYRAVAKYLLPHLRDVPVSVKRYPDTIDGESFWEKDAPSFTPKFVKTYAVPRRGGGPEIRYIVIDGVRTLTWLAEIGGIEIHPFLHRTAHIERATSVVFDLDPGEGASIVECCEVALLLRDALQGIGFTSLAKVSGSKGLQIYVPLNGDATHEITQPFARLVAEEVAKKYPKLALAKMSKELRRGRVFIDWSQNADFKTTVSVYSLRTKRERPYVSMPVTWEEVGKRRALDFEPGEAVARLRRKGDLFRKVLTLRQELPRLHPPRSLDVVHPERSRRARDDEEVVVHGIRLPKPKSQGGRRLFVMPNADELWLDIGGEFHRWVLRPGPIAVHAGKFRIEKSWYRGEETALDIGAYEIIEGSFARGCFDLYFTGRTLQGAWVLEKISEDPKHRSWSFRPAS
jgi:bifunctional non-homologous end joining protein LigD